MENNLAGLGVALAAMRPDDGGRYGGLLMVSALPHAPVVPHRRTYAARLRRLLQWRDVPSAPRGARRRGGAPQLGGQPAHCSGT